MKKRKTETIETMVEQLEHFVRKDDEDMLPEHHRKSDMYIQTAFNGRKITGHTIITDNIRSACGEIIASHADLYEDMAKEVEQIKESLKPETLADEVEVELAFDVTEEGNVCLMSDRNKGAIRVKAVWKNGGK